MNWTDEDDLNFTLHHISSKCEWCEHKLEYEVWRYMCIFIIKQCIGLGIFVDCFSEVKTKGFNICLFIC